MLHCTARRTLLMVGIGACLPHLVRGEEVRLRYVARYEHQSTVPDHIMGVENVLGDHALVCSNLALTLVDLNALPEAGTQAYLDRLPGLDAYTSVTRGDGYSFVNLRLGGFAVVQVDPVEWSLTLLCEVSEPEVYFEKMAVVGDRLYVAAHAYGIRIYDVSNPADPTLIGSLSQGLDDAFAIALAGSLAYVADGAGGLKIVDLSDETTPMLVAGENPTSAAATAEDVILIDNDVFVACGGAGVAVYPNGDLAARVLYDTPRCAKHLAPVGGHLAVADIGGLEVFARAPDAQLIHAARETGLRRSAGGAQVSLRLWHGVDGWGNQRILTADWDSMDVYELVSPLLDDQPDIIASPQRIRLSPAGGSAWVTLTNAGSGLLQIARIGALQPSFVAQPDQAQLQPGESAEMIITYAGGQPGSGLILIDSNDPDESPLPIQVFGETAYLDPGEPAVPFSLESWTLDHATGWYSPGVFDLQAHAGKIVFFQVFGTW